MKKISLKPIFFCLALIVLAGCAKREIANINSRGKNIICFGDSITFGYGVNRGEDYPAVLAKMVNRPVLNAGIDGNTTPEALRRIKRDVLDREPYLMIIEFCGNDFIKNVPLDNTEQNIIAMIDAAQAKGAMVALVDISAGMFLSQYRDAFAEIARQKKAIFISSILSGIITNPSMKSDFLHPNARGYKIIARQIHRAIAAYLRPIRNPG